MEFSLCLLTLDVLKKRFTEVFPESVCPKMDSVCFTDQQLLTEERVLLKRGAHMLPVRFSSVKNFGKFSAQHFTNEKYSAYCFGI